MRSRGVAAVLIALAVLVAAGLAANPPAIQWQRTYFGEGVARGGWVEPTTDGGFIAAGLTFDHTTELGFDYYLVKVDSVGVVEWEKTFGGEWDDEARCVQPTAAGGYVVVGTGTEPFAGAPSCRQPYLVAVDGDGNLLWERVYLVDSLELAYSVRQTPDGGFIIGGINPCRDTGLCVFKTDSLGLLEWRQSYYMGYAHYTDFIPVEFAYNGGYIIGTRNLLKIDTLGNELWLRSYPEVSDTRSVQRTHDGGYVATGPGLYGPSWDNWDSISVYLLKADSGGNLIWLRHLGGTDSYGGFCVAQTADSGFIVAARASLNTKWNAGLIIRADADGFQRWRLPLEGPSDIECVRQTADGGFILAGWRTAPPNGYTGLTLWKFAPEGQ